MLRSGTLKAYMHGYFMDVKLYQKLLSVAKPFAFEEFRRKKIAEEVDRLRGERIVNTRSLPRVNSEYVKELLAQDRRKKKKGKSNAGEELLGDDRFKAMFSNPEFKIDKNNEIYRLNKPVERRRDEDSEEEEAAPGAEGSRERTHAEGSSAASLGMA